jgi:hypothetical protein
MYTGGGAGSSGLHCVQYWTLCRIVSVEEAAAVATADSASALSGTAGATCRATWAAVTAASQGRSTTSFIRMASAVYCNGSFWNMAAWMPTFKSVDSALPL